MRCAKFNGKDLKVNIYAGEMLIREGKPVPVTSFNLEALGNFAFPWMKYGACWYRILSKQGDCSDPFRAHEAEELYININGPLKRIKKHGDDTQENA